jgi:hypothetical protein
MIMVYNVFMTDVEIHTIAKRVISKEGNCNGKLPDGNYCSNGKGFSEECPFKDSNRRCLPSGALPKAKRYLQLEKLKELAAL